MSLFFCKKTCTWRWLRSSIADDASEAKHFCSLEAIDRFYSNAPGAASQETFQRINGRFLQNAGGSCIKD